jgi:hypothetical protein
MSPWITIVVVAYQRYDSLPIIIHSFLVQSNPHWKMLILHDGPDDKHASMAQPYLDQHSNIDYHQSQHRFNDYGHSLREWSINDLVDTEWICLTNDDNYYVPTFLSECKQIIDKEETSDFIMFDSLMNIPIHNSIQYNPYNTQYSYPKVCTIDMGSFISKTALLKQVGFNSKLNIADGLLIEDLLSTFPDLSIYKINQTLFVHN